MYISGKEFAQKIPYWCHIDKCQGVWEKARVLASSLSTSLSFFHVHVRNFGEKNNIYLCEKRLVYSPLLCFISVFNRLNEEMAQIHFPFHFISFFCLVVFNPRLSVHNPDNNTSTKDTFSRLFGICCTTEQDRNKSRKVGL